MNTRLIVDSTCDLPSEILKKYDISVIPIRIYDEKDNEYLDGISIKSNELLEKMKNGEQFTSSLPSYDAIYNTFLANCEAADHCIYLSCSSELSGTYNFAKIVKSDLIEKFPHYNIEVIDTKSISLGAGILALYVLDKIESSTPFEIILEMIEDKIHNIQHIFTIEDLQYLIRGGRVGKFAGFLGGMLNINPIMEINEGKFKPLEKVRGRKKALNRLLELMVQRFGEENEYIGIVLGEEQEATKEVIDHISNEFKNQKIVINTVGSAVGVHAGPGAFGVFFLTK